MMTQNDLVVVGIDVAKDKVDACIRTVTERRTFPTTASGRRSLIAWLRKHQVGKAGKETVSAEVNNGKVVNMSAGSLPVKSKIKKDNGWLRE